MSQAQLLSADLLEPHRRHLWGLCYRMTGNAADADELVQDTFMRALERPPARTDQPWRPWLVRVAMNLSRDLLRHRRRSPYRGVWLPSPKTYFFPREKRSADVTARVMRAVRPRGATSCSRACRSRFCSRWRR
jgi:RNA polymerase sigma factor (sigma-70 family)